MTYFTDKEYQGINYSVDELARGDYENCRFLNCFFNKVDLSNVTFIGCIFENCDLSMAKISNTAFRNTVFRGCKMLGLHFDECNKFMFSPEFEDCQINLSSFYKLSLKKIVFKDCSLQEIDFVEADLSGSIFDNCDLDKAMFDHTELSKADLRTSYNYSIDPEQNKIKKAKFAFPGVLGLLDKYEIEVG